MLPQNLQGYSPRQRKLAYAIRDNVINQFPWGLDITKAQRLQDKLLSITTPMFWIKYRQQLETRQITQAISSFNDTNYHRRANFAARG